MSESLVLLSFGPGEFLALTPVELAQARDRAQEILVEGTATYRGAQATTRSPEPLLTAEQISEVTGVPAPWFLEQARCGKVPHHKLGKYVRFRFDEVLVCSRFRVRAK